MIRRLERSSDRVIGYSVADAVSDEEYQQLTSELRDEIARHGRIRVLFRISDVPVTSFFTSLEDRFQFLKEHRDDIERVAVVTDDTATELLAKVTEPLRGAETETFSMDEEPKAWAWLE
jgi:hypothetical protein